jgi:hypothetical protein
MGVYRENYPLQLLSIKSNRIRCDVIVGCVLFQFSYSTGLQGEQLLRRGYSGISNQLYKHLKRTLRPKCQKMGIRNMNKAIIEDSY